MILHALREAGPVTLILAHMGGWRCWEEVLDLLPQSGAYIDTSFSLGRLTPNGDGHDWDPAELEMLDAERFTALVRAFGAKKVLFGSDSPWADQAEALAAFLRLPLTIREQALILHENAEKLLG